MAKPISIAPADIQHGLTVFSNAKVDLGIVSPCSKCKNRRAQQTTKDINGQKVSLPACPRQALIDAASKNAQTEDDQVLTRHLRLTGKNGSFQNPILDDSNKTLWIWVARLLDNSGSYSMEGHLDRINSEQTDSEVCPPITASGGKPEGAPHKWDEPGGYDTDFMQCMALPMIPDTSAMETAAKGMYKEGQYVLITHFQGQQVTKGRTPIPFGGFAHRVDAAGAMKIMAPQNHQAVNS